MKKGNLGFLSNIPIPMKLVYKMFHGEGNIGLFSSGGNIKNVSNHN